MPEEDGRWERLFADLELQAHRAARAGLDAELPDRTRSARADVTFADRLRASVGGAVTLRLRGGLALEGVLREVSAEWLLLLPEGTSTSALVPCAAVLGAHGVSGHAVPAGSAVADRYSLRSVLRGVARDRSPVRVWLTDGGVVEGTLDHVGHDHVDLAVHHLDEPRRAASVRRTLVLLTSSLAVVRPADGTSSLGW
jgi:small nuclear ribonucleoprotein (snRNP)-like protein